MHELAKGILDRQGVHDELALAMPPSICPAEVRRQASGYMPVRARVGKKAHIADTGQGHSLKEIGDQLGHSDPEATRIYAKVDLTGLRQVAAFDLGGLL